MGTYSISPRLPIAQNTNPTTLSSVANEKAIISNFVKSIRLTFLTYSLSSSPKIGICYFFSIVSDIIFSIASLQVPENGNKFSIASLKALNM